MSVHEIYLIDRKYSCSVDFTRMGKKDSPTLQKRLKWGLIDEGENIQNPECAHYAYNGRLNSGL